MDTSAPMILCADSLHDDGASVWARDDDAEGHFKKQLFVPYTLQPFKALTPEGKPFEGIIGMSPSEWNAGTVWSYTDYITCPPWHRPLCHFYFL